MFLFLVCCFCWGRLCCPVRCLQLVFDGRCSVTVVTSFDGGCSVTAALLPAVVASLSSTINPPSAHFRIVRCRKDRVGLRLILPVVVVCVCGRVSIFRFS